MEIKKKLVNLVNGFLGTSVKEEIPNPQPRKQYHNVNGTILRMAEPDAPIDQRLKATNFRVATLKDSDLPLREVFQMYFHPSPAQQQLALKRLNDAVEFKKQKQFDDAQFEAELQKIKVELDSQAEPIVEPKND